MCVSSICTWNNRLGNHLITILNVLHYTYHYKFTKSIIFPNHPYFTINIPDINKSSQCICHCDNIIDLTRRINPCSDFFCISITQMKYLYDKYISYKLYNNIKKVSYNIAMHIRSGDIFGNNIHWEYVQPPFDYYLQGIINNPNKSIVIVYETIKNHPTWKNPIIDKLKEYVNNNNLKNVTFQSSSLNDDLHTLMCCEYLFTSYGTFCLVPYFVSPHIKKLIIPEYMVNKLRGKKWFKLTDECLNKVKPIKITKYINVGSWKNTPEQHNIMLTYKINNDEIYKFNCE